MSSRELSQRDYRELARFRRALRAFLHFSDVAARDAGLTPAQHQLLLAVHGRDQPERPTTTDIAAALHLRLHSTVELAARAEANGLLTRRTDPTDHRRALLELTDHGQEKLAELSRIHREELRRCRAELSDVLHRVTDTD